MEVAFGALDHIPVVVAGRRSAPPAGVAGLLLYRLPPASYFLGSAVFHYLGPALAVLLFSHVAVLGVAWLRIASAALVFAAWRRPWRRWARLGPGERRTLVQLGVVLAAMNSCFYLAIERLPLGTVGAIEFLGPITLAAAASRSRRNLLSLLLAGGGVALLAEVSLSGQPLAFGFAFANCVLFALYVVLGHRLAASGAGAGVDRLGLSMLVALLVITPIGLPAALPSLGRPVWALAGAGVGVCSSVIPYVCDQLAMARLRRGSFALMLALLPACAVGVGLLVLGQVPTWLDLLGVGAVVAGVAVRSEPPRAPGRSG